MQVTINACLHHKLKYTQAAASFHQWRDQRQFFGFNFASQDDANKFFQIVKDALDVLVAGKNLLLFLIMC